MMCSSLSDAKGIGDGSAAEHIQDSPSRFPNTTTTTATTTTPEHSDIAFWQQRIREWYPRWLERTYFVPPVLMCKTLSDTVTLNGQSVKVPQAPVNGPTPTPTSTPNPNPTSTPTSNLTSTPTPHTPTTTPTAAGGKKKKESPPSLLASDVTEDETQQRILHCLHKLSHVQKDVMFALSQLRYEDYLSDPCFQATSRTLPRPVDLTEDNKHRGDFDVLLIHRHYGVMVCEIKSVGAQFSSLSLTEREQETMISGRLVSAIKQLNKSADVLRHLLSDLPPASGGGGSGGAAPSASPPRVRTSLVLPNVSAVQLRKVLAQCPGISRELCQCLGTEANRDPVDLCLTSDRVPDVTTPYDVNADVIRKLRQWWQIRMTNDGVDTAMSDSVYLELLARFSGPATTVRVFFALKPRLHLDVVRTEGEGVVETARRFTQIMLTPYQLALQNTPEPLVVLSGPPGTGKSLMLVLKGLEWLRQGWHVHVVSTWNQSLAMTFNIVHQLSETLGEGVHGRVHMHELDLLTGGRRESERGVRMLLQASAASQEMRGPAARQQPLCVLVDEAYDGLGSQFKDMCHQLQTSLPPGMLFLWVACMHHDKLPPLLMEVPLTHPLRSPPSITREVQQSSSLKTGIVYNYTTSPCPLPSDGLPPVYLWHSGKDHQTEEIRHCVPCGRNVAAFLKRDLHVGVAIPGRPRSGSGCGIPQSPGLQFRDVFLLSYYALDESNGVVQGLRREGIPVTVMKTGDTATTARVARAEVNEVVVAHLSLVSGLERKVVVWLQGDRPNDEEEEEGEGGEGERAGGQVYDEQYSRLYAMSRCTAQLVCVMLSPVKTKGDHHHHRRHHHHHHIATTTTATTATTTTVRRSRKDDGTFIKNIICGHLVVQMN